MLTLLALLVATPQAEARIYSTPIFAEDEVELRELYTDGVLTEEELELLLELINDPVNLNKARRKQLYDLPGITMGMAQRIVQDRKTNGPFASLEQLMRVEGMGAMAVEQLRAFVELEAPTDVAGNVRGYVKAKTALHFDPQEVIDDDHPARTHTAAQLGYDKAPNTYLKGRFKYKKGTKAGIALLSQDGVNGLAYDPESRDLFASWAGPGLQFGKAYLHMEDKNREVVAGSFTAGFGAGLTFDTTNRTHPDGLYSDLTLTGTDRFSLRKGLMGVGGSLISAPLGGGSTTLDATVFASTQRYDIYMYDVGVAGGEKIDPQIEDEPSPRVWVQAADGTWQKGGWLTLPNLYRESLAGGNATVVFNERAEVGLTAYLSHYDTTTVQGVEDPYELVLRSGYPVDHTFGAVGVHGGLTTAYFDVLGEFSQSFTGGQGVLVKSIIDLDRGELEASLRHYGTDFDNPHARGLANADEYGGMRDRDEQGFRLKGQYEPTLWLDTRVLGDVWRRPSTGQVNMQLYGRVEVRPSDDLSVMGFAQHVNRDLAHNGRNMEYGGDFTLYDEYGLDEPGFDVLLDDTEVVEGAGTKNYYGAQLKLGFIPRTKITMLYKRTYTDAGYWYPGWEDGTFCDYWFQTGHYAWFKIRVKPVDATAITLRGRYEDEDVHGDKGSRYVEGYLQVDQKLPKRVKVALRGTLYQDLTDPENTWEGTCDSAGAPDLCGSCICEDDTDSTSEEDLKTKGMVWASVEWRF